MEALSLVDQLFVLSSFLRVSVAPPLQPSRFKQADLLKSTDPQRGVRNQLPAGRPSHALPSSLPHHHALVQQLWSGALQLETKVTSVCS